MIRIRLESLAALPVEGVMRPVRSDLTPVSAASRDLGLAAGEAVEERLQSVGALPVANSTTRAATMIKNSSRLDRCSLTDRAADDSRRSTSCALLKRWIGKRDPGLSEGL